MDSKKYYLGLDIGTDSVGYAVTDKQYALLKYHGEPMWGVTLFDAAGLNAERRSYRTARRRLARRRQRVCLLQELFAKEIAKVDRQFFIRLQNSRLCKENGEDEGSVFGSTGDYTDAQYHSDYPTVHHLICELMTSDERHDPRLVYLACAWLVSHRGHFLSEIGVDHIGELTDFGKVYADLMEYLSASEDTVIPWAERNPSAEDIGAVLQKKCSVTAKYRALCEVLLGTPKAPKTALGFPYNPEVFLKALCGSTVKAADLFGTDEYSEIESFSLDADDEKLAAIMARLGDNAALLEKMKAVFDWAVLAHSLEGSRSISEAKVKTYERHKSDLADLKRLLHKYAPEQFRAVFRAIGGDNYAAYSGHSKRADRPLLKKTDKEKFSKYIKRVMESLVPDDGDRALVEDIKARLDLRTFLPKQKDTDNRVLPHQLYLWELNEILKHASAYLPFLNETDENGICVSEKIRTIFTFRIPYYVGPLNPYCKEHAWAVFRPGKEGRILPWNFSDTVDEDASEAEFIRRMTNKCTYLPAEDVLPKDSLLYHRFEVLNEINNLKIDGVGISVETKQNIYNDLFMTRRKVTVKNIRDYLIGNGVMRKDQVLSGIDETVKSDLKPWLDFRRLMESGALTVQQVESIIERRTYSEERPRFVKWLREKFAFLPEEDLVYISKLNYKDFGRLSRAFLDGLDGVDKTGGTGEAYTVISAMWNTNCNLMELLSGRFTYQETVEQMQRDYYSGRALTLNERLDEMYISNAVKRPVIRSLEIVKEAVKALGTPPEKIFVEMARGGTPEQKGKRTKSRKEQILELYDACDRDVRFLRQQLADLGEEADSRLQGDRLFLYFMQLGKCMYSGENIDICKLGDATYNIEHIYPRAYVKDDSVLNNEVLVKSELNGQKSDDYPIQADIRHSMADFWSNLRQNGLITEEKYRRLTRSTPFTAEEKLGFINRQLTETTQSTKAVATLLREFYPSTEVVYVKARLTSEFRQQFHLLKSRTFNDLHHAKDAYLNIVTGNVYDMKFLRPWFRVDAKYSLKTETVFTQPLICGEETVWDGERMLSSVKQTVGKNVAHMTKYAFCRHGGFFDQMPVKAAPELVPLKKGLPTEKYGGYNKPTVTFFALVKYRVGKKSDIMVMPVELLYKDEFLAGGPSAELYAKKQIGSIVGKAVEEVSFPLGMRILKINTVLSLDGFRVCIAGSAGGGKQILVSPLMPFAADRATETYMKRLEAMVEKANNRAGYIYHAEYDKVTPQENLKLYDLYIEKLEKSIYRKRPNGPLRTLQNGREKFVSLSPVEQAKALLNIHQVFGRVSGGCDLESVGGCKTEASIKISANLSNWKKAYSDVRIVDTSASGLWEKRSDNLLELL